MTDLLKDEDQEKGDDILRRMLKTPPKPHDDGKSHTASKAEPEPAKKSND